MSLLVASSSTASRHLRRHLIANVDTAASAYLRISNASAAVNNGTRHFSSKGSAAGLRRAQTKGRRSSSTPKSAQQSTPAASSSSNNASSDPHLLANERVSSANTAMGDRPPGTESLAKLTTEQKVSNFAMAGGLFAFVSYIFYYSLSSVGGEKNAKALIFGADKSETQQNAEGGPSNPGFEEFLKEANDGRTQEEQRLKAEKDAKGEARELVSLESSTAARLKAEGVGEDVIVAGSANEEEEREMARMAGFADGGEGQVVKKRSLWKRVVFFWRRE